MKNITIQMVVKSNHNHYRPIEIGDLIDKNELVENKVTLNGDSRVFHLKSKDGPGFPAKPARKIAGQTVFFGRIMAIQSGDEFLFVWAGKHPETNKALQRIETISRLEFEQLANLPFSDPEEAEPKPFDSSDGSAPEPVTTSGNGPVSVALRKKKDLDGKKAGAMAVSHSSLLADFGYRRATKGQSRKVQEALEALGIVVVPAIYHNPYDHVLLASKDGYLSTNYPELLTMDNPCKIIEAALECELES